MKDRTFQFGGLFKDVMVDMITKADVFFSVDSEAREVGSSVQAEEEYDEEEEEEDENEDGKEKDNDEELEVDEEKYNEEEQEVDEEKEYEKETVDGEEKKEDDNEQERGKGVCRLALYVLFPSSGCRCSHCVRQ